MNNAKSKTHQTPKTRFQESTHVDDPGGHCSDSSVSSASLEAQLDQALSDERPTFVFLHSLDCIPCKEMMGVVADVYPEFQDSIVLVDVDVYDQNNQNILRRERLQSIPTLVFYDSQGTRQVFIGAMPADQFHDILTQLAAGQ